MNFVLHLQLLWSHVIACKCNYFCTVWYCEVFRTLLCFTPKISCQNC